MISDELVPYIGTDTLQEALSACGIPGTSTSFEQVEECGYLKAVILSQYESYSRYMSKIVKGFAQSSYVGIRSSLAQTKRDIKEWAKHKKTFVTFNDLSPRGGGNQAVAAYMAEFLQSLFPQKSSFEVYASNICTQRPMLPLNDIFISSL